MKYEEIAMFQVEKDAKGVVAEIFQQVEDRDMTFYELSKILNKALAELNILKNDKVYQVRPQMMYNYNRNKMIVKGQSVQRVTRTQAYEFIIRFIERTAK